MIWIELAVLLLCILLGARLGGIGLGAVAGIGLCVFVFALGLPPGGPPGVVIGMILAVITALAAMQAAGGLDYLVGLAERLLRRRPQNVTFLAPVVVWVLVFASGTTHVIYALLPVIAEVSRKADIRPERPLSISVIAGFQGVIASPISAATVALVGVLAGRDVSLGSVLAITVPSTLVGVLVGALSVAWRGAPLSEDAGYRARLAEGKLEAPQERVALEGATLVRARRSTLLFLAGIAAVVLLGMFPELRPEYTVIGEAESGSDQVTMPAAIMIVMITVAGLVLVLCKASPEKAVKGNIMSSGVTAVICILGVSWLGSSFFEGNRPAIVEGISELVRSQPWTFAVGLFVLSSLLFSAAATVVILAPVAVALAMPTEQLVAFYPAANAVFFLPTYGTLIAACSFDQTGTTRIGRFLLNHSFMLPGLVTTTTAIVLAWSLGAALM